uniref:Uncharacterized protein n=1 Tax=Urocitellus parryii TaxID=9999 RepID=A0A8D2GUH7_UROPR
ICNSNGSLSSDGAGSTSHIPASHLGENKPLLLRVFKAVQNKPYILGKEVTLCLQRVIMTKPAYDHFLIPMSLCPICLVCQAPVCERAQENVWKDVPTVGGSKSTGTTRLRNRCEAEQGLPGR